MNAPPRNAEARRPPGSADKLNDTQQVGFYSQAINPVKYIDNAEIMLGFVRRARTVAHQRYFARMAINFLTPLVGS